MCSSFSACESLASTDVLACRSWMCDDSVHVCVVRAREMPPRLILSALPPAPSCCRTTMTTPRSTQQITGNGASSALSLYTSRISSGYSCATDNPHLTDHICSRLPHYCPHLTNAPSHSSCLFLSSTFRFCAEWQCGAAGHKLVQICGGRRCVSAAHACEHTDGSLRCSSHRLPCLCLCEGECASMLLQ